MHTTDVPMGDGPLDVASVQQMLVEGAAILSNIYRVVTVSARLPHPLLNKSDKLVVFTTDIPQLTRAYERTTQFLVPIGGAYCMHMSTIDLLKGLTGKPLATKDTSGPFAPWGSVYPWWKTRAHKRSRWYTSLPSS